ncbi:MAG: hypothetical protein J07HQW1_00128 [Haloquadratum walsbyi J07HQW1]|uniref:Uncharacterized protein n=1 Tax=Haloquadratum walsbyi J07HQW1 TaxID=1238424 RepID=U1N0X2_9EURY|nr:MAG: hypothetical protein J07HQW1_00128 [Haloquadratum walsbyi J07HQW1]
MSRGDAAIQAAMPPVIAAITSRLLAILCILIEQINKSLAVHADFIILVMYNTYGSCLCMYNTWIANHEALVLPRSDYKNLDI